MTANIVPQRPVEHTSSTMSDHDRRIGIIAAWLGENSGVDLSVDVVTGSNRVPIARGRYVDMEAHPSAEGVYRLVFDNSKARPDAAPGPQWVSVGHELVDVAAGDRSLIIDKGSQRVEVHVIETVAPEATQAPQTAPAAAPVARVAPAPMEDVSILEAYAPSLEAVATAPVYQNAAVPGSKLFGETRLEVVGDELRVTARRMRRGTPFLVMTGIIVSAFAFAGLVLYGLAIFNANRSGVPADPEYLRTTLTGTAAVAVAAVVLYLAGRLLSAGRKPEKLVVPLSEASGRKSGRVFVLRAPVGRRGRLRKLVLKPAGKADRARLKEILDALRG